MEILDPQDSILDARSSNKTQASKDSPLEWMWKEISVLNASKTSLQGIAGRTQSLPVGENAIFVGDIIQKIVYLGPKDKTV